MSQNTTVIVVLFDEPVPGDEDYVTTELIAVVSDSTRAEQAIDIYKVRRMIDNGQINGDLKSLFGEVDKVWDQHYDGAFYTIDLPIDKLDYQYPT